MKYKSIETDVGYVSGRNAIYLDKINFDYESQAVSFVGQFDSALCSSYNGNAEWLDYIISFFRVINFSMCELDHYSLKITNQMDSSIECVKDSSLLIDLKSNDHSIKVRPEHKHFVLSTYDDILDIVAFNIVIEVKEADKRSE